MKQELSTLNKEYSSLEEKLKGQERVVRESKKQLKCYKEEITGIKKMENYLTLENY